METWMRGITKSFRRFRDLAYGENRDQSPAAHFEVDDPDLRHDPLALHVFKVETGDPSYIAMADFDSGLCLLCLLAEEFRAWKGRVPYLAIACKHGNPCGAGFSWESKEQAVRNALYGDRDAVMGGELLVNFDIDDALGHLVFAVPEDRPIGRKLWGLDLVVAPSFTPGVIEELGKKEKRRLLSNPELREPFLPPDEWMYRPVRGGMLTQRYPRFLFNPATHAVGVDLTDAQFDDLILARCACWAGSSNSVMIAKNGMIVGRGFGQQDRRACVRLCLQYAADNAHDLTGSMFASDAFLPFATHSEDGDYVALHALIAQTGLSDRPNLVKLGILARAIQAYDKREGTELLADAGCAGGIVPGDGQRLAEVKAYFAQRGLKVVYLPPENRGFAKH